MTLTVAYITSRLEPHIEWFFDSLRAQDPLNEHRIIVVSLNGQMVKSMRSNVLVTRPKPSVWQGAYRKTREDWWAKSNAMNTAICLCETDWIAFVDDRSVLLPGWLDSVKEAMSGDYAVCGTYEKRAGLKVENGVITDYGTLLGKDDRGQDHGPVPTTAWHGGSCALPLEWCLKVNGYSEDVCDGLGSEDSMFGATLKNSLLPMRYDPRMKIIEDRTPGKIEGALKRADKNPHLGRQAKSWAIVRIFHDKTQSQNSYDIRNMRDRILLNHEQFPPPSANDFDWYDGERLCDMK